MIPNGMARPRNLCAPRYLAGLARFVAVGDGVHVAPTAFDVPTRAGSRLLHAERFCSLRSQRILLSWRTTAGPGWPGGGRKHPAYL